jgi:hypothetical protein
LSLYIFFKGPCDSFLLELEVGIDYLTKLKKSIRARCRAHLSRQLEPVHITRVLGAKLADMILKKAWTGVRQSPPDFFWHNGQDPGLSWAKRGLTQAMRGLKKVMYGSLCLQKITAATHKNIPLRLTTAKGNIGKWATRLSEMMKMPQFEVSQKTRDPKVSLVAPKYNFDKLYAENHINGDARPMARDGDQIAFYVERDIGKAFYYSLKFKL